jgi:hypothetical protein
MSSKVFDGAVNVQATRCHCVRPAAAAGCIAGSLMISALRFAWDAFARDCTLGAPQESNEFLRARKELLTRGRAAPGERITATIQARVLMRYF